MAYIFGVDIGGTTLKFGVFDENLKRYDQWAIDTDLQDSGKRIIPTIARKIKSFMKKNNIEMQNVKGIGMGIPGPVDNKGFVKVCVNLFWENFNPIKELQKEFPHIHIAAGNDANVAALGEFRKGAGKKYNSMLFVTLGTGVGGGVIVDGKILAGVHGLAGEIGHIAIGPKDSGKCNCGNCGCVDQFASATGIIRRMEKILDERPEDSVLRNYKTITAKDVCQAASNGDALATECIELCMGVLGKGLAYFTHAIDPEVIVIGGGVSKAGKIITDAISKEYNKNLFLIDKGAEIFTAELGNDAGIIGAASLI